MNPDQLAVLVPIVGIVFGVGFAVVSVYLAHRQRVQRTELRHKERLAAIEHGLELPPDPPEPSVRGLGGRYRDPARALHGGLVLLFAGLAMAFAARGLLGEQVASIGVVIAAIGAAKLAFYAIEQRRSRRDGATPGCGNAP